MSYFTTKCFKKGKKINKTLNIDEQLYIQLEYLSNFIYNASITRLINLSIEKLIETENIQLYERKNQSYVVRSFLIEEYFLEKLYKLKEKYNVSICLLINIAIRNALSLENIKKC